jgi:hypothetical protein
MPSSALLCLLCCCPRDRTALLVVSVLLEQIHTLGNLVIVSVVDFVLATRTHGASQVSTICFLDPYEIRICVVVDVETGA